MSNPFTRTLLIQEVGLLARTSTNCQSLSHSTFRLRKAIITSLAYLFIMLAAHPRQPPSALTVSQHVTLQDATSPPLLPHVHNQHEVILTHDRKTIHHHVYPCVRHSTIQFQHLIEASEPVVASFFCDIGRARIWRRPSAMAMELFMYPIYLTYMKKLDYSHLPLSVPVMLPRFL
jgi:hypothetical protein